MLELDVTKWAEQQFGACELGDRRRTRRAVKYAAQAAADPDSSTPQQAEKWSDLKAAYRLCDAEDVTFRSLAEPHWKLTRASFAGRRHVLLVDDTADVCFNNRKPIAGMGMITHSESQGFLLHSSLAVDADSREVLGLAAQVIRHRRRVKKQHARQRLKRKDRESRMWGDVIDMVGASDEVIYTHVCDRGADNFEVYCHLVQQRSKWVIRTAQLTRAVLDAEGERRQIKELLGSLPLAGTYELKLRARPKQPARTALLEVRFTSITMPRPGMTSDFVKACGIREIPMYLVEVREVMPAGMQKWPRNFKPLHWVLCTAHEVTTFSQAWDVIEMYERRYIVEEYHKALKTGCSLESRQHETAERLEAVTGVLAVVAVRLLQLKTVAQRDPQRPAREVVPGKWVTMLSTVRKRPITTVRQFFREMAGLGGFLARKSDGEPGWMTLWRGFEKLHLLLRGAEAARRKCG